MQRFNVYIILASVTLVRSDILLPIDPSYLPKSFLTGNNHASTPCNDITLTHCQNSFNSYLNISTLADWTNPAILNYALTRIFRTGIDDGLLKVCQARSLFYECLGSSYFQCIDRFNFMRNGLSPEVAYAYVEIMQNLEFMCNGGLLQSIRSWTCILTIDAQYVDTETKCRNDFNATVIQNPASICNAASILSLCLRLPYTVGWWQCERVRLAFDLDNACPNIKCQVTRQSDDNDDIGIVSVDSGKTIGEVHNYMRPELKELFIDLAENAHNRMKEQETKKLPNTV